MAYVFGILAIINVLAFGYFWTKSGDNTTAGTLQDAKAQLQKPLAYQNNSKEIPPLIGEKDPASTNTK